MYGCELHCAVSCQVFSRTMCVYVCVLLEMTVYSTAQTFTVLTWQQQLPRVMCALV